MFLTGHRSSSCRHVDCNSGDLYISEGAKQHHPAEQKHHYWDDSHCGHHLCAKDSRLQFLAFLTTHWRILISWTSLHPNDSQFRVFGVNTCSRLPWASHYLHIFLLCPSQVWGHPPTTSQLMSKIERRKEHLFLGLDFDDFMMPFSHNIQRKTLDLTKHTD